ncbi:unnamed protein product [Penicillium viridicatum]
MLNGGRTSRKLISAKAIVHQSTGTSLTGQRDEYRTAVQDVETSLNMIDGIAAFALRKVIAEIQKEADSVLLGEQNQPIVVTDDDPRGDHDNDHDTEGTHAHDEDTAQPDDTAPTT